MGWWNNAKAFIRGNGNLSLGLGVDDGAYDTSHPYAKNDVWFQVDVTNLRGIPTTSLTMSDVRTAVGQYGRVFTSGGAITPKVPIYLPIWYRTYTGSRQYGSAPHGIKVNYMILSYTIATADATSVAVVFTTETAQTNSTTRAQGSSTPLGAVTYENPIGTSVSVLPVGQDADPLVSKIIPATPIFITDERTILTAELQLSLPNTCVLTVTEIALNCSVAWY